MVKGRKNLRRRGRFKRPSRRRLPGRSLPVRVFVGSGGSGKTLLALGETRTGGWSEWDPYYWNQGTDVYWIPAYDEVSLEAGLLGVAGRLGITAHEVMAAGDNGRVLEDLLLERLGTNRRQWWLILDGLDDPALLASSQSPIGILRERIPRGLRHYRGRISVTSRITDPAAWGRWTTLNEIVPGQAPFAGEVLRRHAKAFADVSADWEGLAARLGNLPLASRLAGRYLHSTTTKWRPEQYSFSHAWALLEGQLAGALDEGAAHDQTIRALSDLALGLLSSRGLDHARSLLLLLSRFAPVSIPFDLLQAAVGACPLFQNAPVSGTRPITEQELQQTVAALGDLRLLHTHDGTANVALDSTVAEVQLKVLKSEPAMADAALEAVIDMLHHAVLAVDPDDPAKARWWPALVPHICAISRDAHAGNPRQVKRFTDAANQVAVNLLRAGHLRGAHHVVQAAAGTTPPD